MGRQMDLPSMAEFKKILGLTAAFLAFPIGMSIFAAKSSFLTWSPQFYMGTLAFFSWCEVCACRIYPKSVSRKK